MPRKLKSDIPVYLCFSCNFPFLLCIFITDVYHIFCPQLAAKEGRKKESFQEARFDYYNMDRDDDDNIDLRDDELSHIVEIYDFPPEFKTEDLLKLFQYYQYV